MSTTKGAKLDHKYTHQSLDECEDFLEKVRVVCVLNSEDVFT